MGPDAEAPFPRLWPDRWGGAHPLEHRKVATSAYHRGMSEAADSLAEIRSKIAEACVRSGRDPSEVTLIGASKTVTPDRIREFVESGLTDLGENYVRELREKEPLFPEVRWHYFGALQSGSARHVAAHADVIHTFVPGSGLERLSSRLVALGREVPGLMEVDFTGGRSGVAPEDLRAAASLISSTPGVRLAGLMTLPAFDPDPEAARPSFRRLRLLAESLRETFPEVLELSMGMSLDYEVALEEGATMLRVGTALFGRRPTGY